MADSQQGTDLLNKKSMRSVKFFNQYLSNIGRLMLTNILLIPFNIFVAGYIYFLYRSFDGINILAASAVLIIFNIGMAGVAQVCRYIYIDKEFSTVAAFFKGIRENALRFFIHGIISYAAFVVSYLSIYLYYKGTSSHTIFWLPLIIAVVITIGLLFMSYYMNIMTITMDISLKSTYRNCILFSFGELKNNAVATFGLLILGGIVFSVVYIINNSMVSIVFIVVMQIFFLPSTFQYILTFYLYDDMVAMLDETKHTIKNDEEDQENKDSPSLNIDAEDAGILEKIYEESSDEFIYYNGRMIRRSEVEKLIENSQ